MVYDSLSAAIHNTVGSTHPEAALAQSCTAASTHELAFSHGNGVDVTVAVTV